MTPRPRPQTWRSADARTEARLGVRKARRSKLAEDYVELIAELIHAHAVARPVDIATRLGVIAPKWLKRSMVWRGMR